MSGGAGTTIGYSPAAKLPASCGCLEWVRVSIRTIRRCARDCGEMEELGTAVGSG